MSVPLLDSLFNQAVKGCSVQVTLVSNQKSGHCTYARGILYYHPGSAHVGSISLPANFSTEDKPLSVLVNDAIDPHTDPPTPFPNQFDPKHALHLGLIIKVDGTVNIIPDADNHPKNILTFAAQESGAEVICGIATNSQASADPQFAILQKRNAPLYVLSFGKIIPPTPPIQ